MKDRPSLLKTTAANKTPHFPLKVVDGESLVSVAKNVQLFYFAKLLLGQLETLNNSFTKSFVSSITS